MKLLDFVFWGSIKQKLKIKRVKLAIKKMQSKNDKALKKYQDKKAYYEQNYPPNSMSAIKPMLYAVCTNYQDLFLSKQDCLEALKYLGYKNPTFLGIYIKKEQIIVDRNTCSRAFFKSSALSSSRSDFVLKASLISSQSPIVIPPFVHLWSFQGP
jgi:hypothetical protein